jgi:hypothetical protein
VTGTSVNIPVLLLPLPNRQWQLKKERRVYHRLLERRQRHQGGRNGSAGIMGPSLDEVCAGRSSTHHIGLGEGIIAVCQSMKAPWAIERVERVQQQRGEGGLQGGGRTMGRGFMMERGQ